MVRYRKIVISVILTLLLFGFVIYPIYNFYKFSYSVVFDDIEEYDYLFNEMVQFNVLFSGIGQIRETDQNYSYLTEEREYIEIYEFSNLNEIPFDNLNFIIVTQFPNCHDLDRELNFDLEGVPLVGIKDKLPLTQELYVGFNKNAPLELIVDKPNCKAYYGRLLKMILSGDSKEPLVLYDFTNVSNTIITFYKTETKLLLIIITSDKKEIRKEDLEILNLQYTS